MINVIKIFKPHSGPGLNTEVGTLAGRLWKLTILVMSVSHVFAGFGLGCALGIFSGGNQPGGCGIFFPESSPIFLAIAALSTFMAWFYYKLEEYESEKMLNTGRFPRHLLEGNGGYRAVNSVLRILGSDEPSLGEDKDA